MAGASTADVFNGLPTRAYAEGGVSSPEVIVSEADGTLALRMWYLARGATTTVAFAFAELDLRLADVDGGLDAGVPMDRLPRFAPFGGNPVIAGDMPLLGSQETCGRGCDIESLAVLDTLDGSGTLWTDPVYLLSLIHI